MTSFLDSPFVWLAIILFAVFIVLILFLKKTKNPKFKEYVPIEFNNLTIEELKRLSDRQGIKIKKGKLRLGTNIIADIDRWQTKKGMFAKMIYDKKKNQYVPTDSEEDSNYDVTILRAKSKNFFYRLFGMKYDYFILDSGSISQFDDISKSWVLDKSMELKLFGNTWINSDSTLEWVTDIATRRTLEHQLNALVNFTPRAIHADLETARRNQIMNAQEDALKNRYESIKKADEASFDT